MKKHKFLSAAQQQFLEDTKRLAHEVHKLHPGVRLSTYNHSRKSLDSGQASVVVRYEDVEFSVPFTSDPAAFIEEAKRRKPKKPVSPGKGKGKKKW